MGDREVARTIVVKLLLPPTAITTVGKTRIDNGDGPKNRAFDVRRSFQYDFRSNLVSEMTIITYVRTHLLYFPRRGNDGSARLKPGPELGSTVSRIIVSSLSSPSITSA